MNRGRVAGLIFLSWAPRRIKFPVAPASSMAWLTSIFMLDVLNRVYCFGGFMLSMEESSVSGSIWEVTSSVQLLWMIVLSFSSIFSSYNVL